MINRQSSAKQHNHSVLAFVYADTLCIQEAMREYSRGVPDIKPTGSVAEHTQQLPYHTMAKQVKVNNFLF